MDGLREALAKLQAIDHTHESDYGHGDADDAILEALRALDNLVEYPGASDLVDEIIKEYEAIPKWYA